MLIRPATSPVSCQGKNKQHPKADDGEDGRILLRATDQGSASVWVELLSVTCDIRCQSPIPFVLKL